MQDILLAGLVLLFFVVFLFKSQSFADTMSPCLTNSKGVKHFQHAGMSCPPQYPKQTSDPSLPAGMVYCCE